MAARSLNKVQLIGNLTRDPELRYTPAGTAVCSFGLATNRAWTTQTGEVKEDTEFHRIVAWNKLAELCSQLLAKGRKVFVEGRLSTRSWTGADNVKRTTTEIVINEMIILDSKRVVRESEIPDEVPDVDIGAVSDVDQESQSASEKVVEDTSSGNAQKSTGGGKKAKKSDTKKKKSEEGEKENQEDERDKLTDEDEVQKETSEDISPEDIPF